ncbi:hypothetical protein OB934_16320 [Aeromonas salmonicida]|uniref:DUF7415 domain-containing protein n=1 Tax=Aeromonas salmonicida TaxID=645 RepID=UPI00259EA3D6|nr:hypothetical protein [Aeromonas salmonicida]MDM5064353.1 hypothetical protein [Aeromonas salmonicida]
MKYINWNQVSELGLIVRINREILHPLGLAMTRNPENGVSEMLMVSPDGFWEYDQQLMTNAPIVSEEEARAKIAAWTKEQQA